MGNLSISTFTIFLLSGLKVYFLFSFGSLILQRILSSIGIAYTSSFIISTLEIENNLDIIRKTFVRFAAPLIFFMLVI